MAENIECDNSLHTSKHGDTLVARLAEKLGMSARAASVYGDPIESDGVTIIPVARVRYGFGGGGGAKDGEEGAGGGGGVQVTPIGYIELRDGNSEFRPIKNPQANWRLLMGGVLFGTFVVSRLYKRLRA